MENGNEKKKGRGRPRKQHSENEDVMKSLQERQHNYYLKYKNKKKNIENKNDQITQEDVINYDEQIEDNKKLSSLLDEVIELMNKIKENKY